MARRSSGRVRHRRARLLAPAALAALAVAAAAGAAGAQPPRPEPPRSAVALLPLDAGARLEIYGQAVATEIARALMAGGVEVVVVGANMDVPDNARLIVDGTLAEKGTVSLSIRVRNRADGTVLDTLSATAPSLAQIDKAAADLSSRVLPVVRERLTALPPDRPGGTGVVRPPPAGVPAGPPLLVGVYGGGRFEPLRAALAGAVEPWVRASGREPRVVDPRALDEPAKAVASANAARAIAFDVVGYSVKPERGVPCVRARVRVRIADAASVLFDRVVVTDTVVGDREMKPDALAARAAEEVLSILVPHVRKAVGPWR